ncbi:hypothetical protein APHNP_1479 [Anaplasma phagocytophilum str. ApNP]|uniref:Uncharacterized protein n=1 Tax=Anaplasma phagocytophilum str. ApNP TaxID=1359153 RepID=A0A0F3NIA3_ANAPH|nr:hypothetical protein APHNP_1479 [Anaplasma phagocytophilum str. ApNP]
MARYLFYMSLRYAALTLKYLYSQIRNVFLLDDAIFVLQTRSKRR